jgi:hypothetical protein
MLDHHDHHFMCISTMIVISYPCTIMFLAPSSHVLLCLTQFTWRNGISNLVSLFTKTKLGLSAGSAVRPTTMGDGWTARERATQVSGVWSEGARRGSPTSVLWKGMDGWAATLSDAGGYHAGERRRERGRTARLAIGKGNGVVARRARARGRGGRMSSHAALRPGE